MTDEIRRTTAGRGLGWFVTVFLLVTPWLAVRRARADIQYFPERKVWVLQAGEATYAFGVNERGELQSIYWGARVTRDTDFAAARGRGAVASFDLSTTTTPQEYPGWGAGLYTEPALKATYANGNRDVVLHFVQQHIDGDTLEITLKDIASELEVHLYYRVFAANNILERWSRIENHTDQVITLESAQSAAWTLPHGEGYGWHYLTGHWGAEWQLHSELVQTGARVIESRRGSTSHQASPWFAIDRPGQTTEESGPVWFGALGWSGSWRITVEQSAMQQLRVTGGFNPFDFGYRLKPGEKLETPPFYAGFTDGGLGQASRLLHRFERQSILPGGENAALRPVLYNSWEATEFNVDEAGQLALAERASKLGVERFVIDDGWFGQRKTDHAGLGDWYVNTEKFPHGLKPVIDRVHALGMDFGIWVEPEMVNPDSDLYRKHPEWAMNFPERPRTESRNQLLLNLARDDVKEYVFQWLDQLVSNNNIAFLKWDYNRNWSEPGWDAVAPEDQKKISVAYVNNLYEILDRLRAKHPKLEIESCSGGGGRVDLGILRRTEEVWPSDNTDALDRLTLQDGFTQAYTPGIMMAWVTDVPNGMNGRSVPLKFRFMVAMNGSLGLGSNLNKWSPEEIQLASRYVAYYKRIRPTVQRGALYRLIAPEGNEFSANEYVSTDGHQAVLFAFLHSQRFGTPFPTVYLRGLAEDAVYKVEAIDASQVQEMGNLSGAYLMHHGVDLKLRGDYDSTSLVLEKQP
jgi:alpha-galactosidase